MTTPERNRAEFNLIDAAVSQITLYDYQLSSKQDWTFLDRKLLYFNPYSNYYNTVMFLKAILTYAQVSQQKRALEVGWGDGGYIPAVLSRCSSCVDSVVFSANIFTDASEKIEILAKKPNEIDNLRVHYADRSDFTLLDKESNLTGLTTDLKSGYDVIIVSKAVAEVPPQLEQLLNVNGRMIVPISYETQKNKVIMVTRLSDKMIYSDPFIKATGESI